LTGSTGSTGSARILELDPELGLRIPAKEIVHARAELVARLLSLPAGHWDVPHDEGARGRLGYLVLEGLLAREMTMAGRTATELLGDGDLVQPWVAQREDGLVRHRVTWNVLMPVRLAILDEGASRSLARWPQALSALLERAIRRTHRMSIHQAMLQLSPVETRLLVLFWHLAERWGHVTPDGIVLRIRLSHALLGQLVGCRRASVTTALQHVYAGGQVARRPDGAWVLRGEPPDELASMHWDAGERPTPPARRRRAHV
jgi:CRP/FNR family cyclic AMP-dependent transcriptional regulator